MLVLLAQGLGLLCSALCCVSTSPIKKDQTPLAELQFFFPLTPLSFCSQFCPKGFDTFPLQFSLGCLCSSFRCVLSPEFSCTWCLPRPCRLWHK